MGEGEAGVCCNSLDGDGKVSGWCGSLVREAETNGCCGCMVAGDCLGSSADDSVVAEDVDSP